MKNIVTISAAELEKAFRVRDKMVQNSSEHHQVISFRALQAKIFGYLAPRIEALAAFFRELYVQASFPRGVVIPARPPCLYQTLKGFVHLRLEDGTTIHMPKTATLAELVQFAKSSDEDLPSQPQVQTSGHPTL